ncbi:MAG: hypothetical protein K6G65_09040 [Lachnospiraceae bacterium]|nr:hypothetical protein [Lachnospiraceae bacterium]
MEELFVYALLCGVGFDEYEKYEETLDFLFENNPDDEMLLDLEYRDRKDAIIHVNSIMNDYIGDCILFGKCLMKELKDIYTRTEITEFGRKMYELWGVLPDVIDVEKEPYYTLSYADDCLSFGDEKQCRELYEKMFDYNFDDPPKDEEPQINFSYEQNKAGVSAPSDRKRIFKIFQRLYNKLMS